MRGHNTPPDPGQDALPVRIRKDAGTNFQQVGQFTGDDVFIVIGGPKCADTFIWWQVQAEGGALTGWIAKGNKTQYFVEPLDGGVTVIPKPNEPTRPSTIPRHLR